MIDLDARPVMLATSTVAPLPLAPRLSGRSPFASNPPALVVANILITPVLQFDPIYESDKGLHGSVGLGTYRQEG